MEVVVYKELLQKKLRFLVESDRHTRGGGEGKKKRGRPKEWGDYRAVKNGLLSSF